MMRFHLAAAAALLATAATAAEYRIEIATEMKEKPYKFYVVSQPTSAGCTMVYAVQGTDATLKSAHFSWTTSGVVIRKDVEPAGVRMVDNGSASIEWKPGQQRKGEKNPLDALGAVFLKLSADGRGDARVVKNPEDSVRFLQNFRFGRSPLMHRPKLPDGELKAGQAFSSEAYIPDGIYAGVEWPVKLDWTVKEVAGGVATLAGAGAATQDETKGTMGLMTDGTIAISSTVKLDAKSGEVVSAETTIDARWKKDPSGSPTGIMDYEAKSVVRETRVDRK
jgi:hypothetical protein